MVFVQVNHRFEELGVLLIAFSALVEFLGFFEGRAWQPLFFKGVDDCPLLLVGSVLVHLWLRLGSLKGLQGQRGGKEDEGKT